MYLHDIIVHSEVYIKIDSIGIELQQNLATVRLDTVRNLIERGNLTCLCLILLFLCIKNLNTMRFDTTRTSI